MRKEKKRRMVLGNKKKICVLAKSKFFFVVYSPNSKRFISIPSAF